MPTSAASADAQCTSAQDVAPFHYRHLGSFAFVGADNAVLEMPLSQKKPSAFTGFLTGLLWKGMESYEQISLKARFTAPNEAPSNARAKFYTFRGQAGVITT